VRKLSTRALQQENDTDPRHMDTDQSDSVQCRHDSLVVDDWNATQLAIPRERQHYDDEVATANPGGTAVRTSPEGSLGAPNLRLR